ncbi:MAG: phosphorylase [Rhodocyclaceae bacterium]|jgi:ATP adenylyltransferase|nr:phosphorylase [Rhodocyclaceae bacterium]
MSKTFIEQVDERIASALQSGALEPIEAESSEVEEAGLRFVLRWVSTLANKDKDKAGAGAVAASAAVVMPGGPRDPNFNPFKNPDPALTVGPVGEQHVAILNKFPVCERHLVLARRVFEEQLLPLAECDFLAMAQVMSEAGGLGFYNGGAQAGASQRHKHVQWIPEAPGNASLALYLPGLPAAAALHDTATHPALAMRHCFVKVDDEQGSALKADVQAFAHRLFQGFQVAREALDMQPGADGLLAPFNLLVGQGWMLVVPRSVECFEGISVAAINFGGSLYVRQREQLELIRKVGPLKMLGSVGQA